jgi:hypothetical protein
VNLITGTGSVFSQGPGTPSVGLKIDLLGRLFVAGGPGGDGRVVSAITGQILASYLFATAPTFVNDVVLTPQAAWFTDTQRAFLYKVPFGRFGRLPGQSDVEAVPFPPGGNRLYLPNARFTTPPTPDTTYNAVAIPKP